MAQQFLAYTVTCLEVSGGSCIITSNIWLHSSSEYLSTISPNTPLEQPGQEASVEPSTRALFLRGSLVGKELGLLLINHVLAAEEIRSLRPHPWLPGPHFVTNDEEKIDRNAEIAGNKVLLVELPIRFLVFGEDTEVLRQCNDDAEE